MQFGGQLFQQKIGNPMETNCAPLPADLFYIRMRYRIRPNYRTVRLGFFKLLGTVVVKYVSTC